MIVLGPRDGDLGGAPLHWREGNWRPDTSGRHPHSCGFPAIPFDRCDLVLEYDARRPERPMPSDQEWDLVSESDGIWKHDPRHGVLRFAPEGPSPSFWRLGREIRERPERGAAHGRFFIGETAAAEVGDGGLDFRFLASPGEGRPRGMRGTFSNLWHWRALDGSDGFPIVQRSAVPAIERVWHGFSMDAELTGPRVEDGESDPEDGGKTIGSLDGLVSNDDRRRFRYGREAEILPLAEFGLTEPETRMEGGVQYFVVSFGGRFLRPMFRAPALGAVTRLRLVFCLAEPVDDDRGAVFLVRYGSPGTGLLENALPEKEAPRALVRFDPGDPASLAEAAFDMEELAPGEPLRFTVERDWRSDGDELRASVHLLSLILEEAR